MSLISLKPKALANALGRFGASQASSALRSQPQRPIKSVLRAVWRVVKPAFCHPSQRGGVFGKATAMNSTLTKAFVFAPGRFAASMLARLASRRATGEAGLVNAPLNFGRGLPETATSFLNH